MAFLEQPPPTIDSHSHDSDFRSGIFIDVPAVLGFTECCLVINLNHDLWGSFIGINVLKGNDLVVDVGSSWLDLSVQNIEIDSGKWFTEFRVLVGVDLELRKSLRDVLEEKDPV